MNSKSSYFHTPSSVPHSSLPDFVHHREICFIRIDTELSVILYVYIEAKIAIASLSFCHMEYKYVRELALLRQRIIV